MTRIRLVLGLVVLLATSALAQEKVTLTDPVHTDPGASEFRLMTLSLDAHLWDVHAVLGEVVPGSAVFIVNGKTLDCHYTAHDAEVVLKSLNTANFSSVSMQKRVIQQCQKDGKIGAGTVSGAPEPVGPPPVTPPPVLKDGRVVPPAPVPPIKRGSGHEGGW